MYDELLPHLCPCEQLGLGTSGAQSLYNLAPSFDILSPVISVSGGNSHTCAVMSNNTVRCWGYNNQGQVTFGTLAFRVVVLFLYCVRSVCPPSARRGDLWWINHRCPRNIGAVWCDQRVPRPVFLLRVDEHVRHPVLGC